MNLKEAFRFQNKLQELMTEAQAILGDKDCVTEVRRTYLRSKVMPGATDETTIEDPGTDHARQIDEMVAFLLYLMQEKETLARCIREAKAGLPIDMDAEVGLNRQRQSVAQTLRQMDALKSSELLVPNGGTGYRFNAEGNQVAYKCDVMRVTTINFDRRIVRREIAKLNKQIDAVSAELDRCLVNSEVGYAAPFDVNDSFDSVFSDFCEARA